MSIISQRIFLVAHQNSYIENQFVGEIVVKFID